MARRGRSGGAVRWRAAGAAIQWPDIVETVLRHMPELSLPDIRLNVPPRARHAWRLARRVPRRYPWVVTCVATTVVFMAVAVATSRHIGIPIRDPEGALLGRRMVSPILLMAVFALFDSALRARRMRRLGATDRFHHLAAGIFLERWWWQRLVLAVVGFLSFAFTYLAYRNLKSFLPLISYRSWDPELLDLDRWMAFGSDPGPVLHDVIGTGMAAYVLSWIYLAFIPLVPMTVAIALTFVPRMREAYVYVAAMMWTWILGVASYYAIPSLGPAISRPAWYDDLPVTSVTRVQQTLIEHRIAVYADPIGYAGVNSVGGFASLHVGIVFMTFLMMRYYRHRMLAWAAFAFLVPTVVATVYFGWHFIIDDVAGFGIGWAAVVLGRVTVYPRLLRLPRRQRVARRADAGAIAKA